MTYEEKLNQTKSSYPFDRWREAFALGLNMFTSENCDGMQKIFDNLIAVLSVKGEAATESEKIELFGIAIEATNVLDAETGMVETGEREDLCGLTNVITTAVGLKPENYGGREGLASEWRDW